MSKKKGPAKTIRYFIEYIIVLLLIYVLKPLSAKSVFTIGRLLGFLSYKLATKRKQIALTNLDIAFSHAKSDEEKKQITKNSFIQMAISILQCLWVIKYPSRVHQLIEKDPIGLDILKKCIDQHKGIFFLTAHYGNWEIMGIYHGYQDKCKLHSIIRRLDNPYLDKMIMEFRKASGNGIFYRDESPLRIVRAIKNNNAVAVMMDQNTAKGGIFVDFFGKKASTPRSVALISYQTGAAILPLFCHPTGKGTYCIEYGPELILKKSMNKNSDVIKWTQVCESFIEKKIRATPHAWMWVHRRWKTQPSEKQKLNIY